MRDKQEKIVVESQVARYLTNVININGKTQAEIAQETGFSKANMITMIKQGRSKLPITRVKAMAESLGIDPKYLLQMCFEEYQPGVWRVIEEIFGASSESRLPETNRQISQSNH